MKVRDVYITNPAKNVNNHSDYINYIDTSSVNQGRLDNVQYLLNGEYPSRAQRKIEDGDILYSSVRPNLRHYYLYKDCLEHPVASTGFVLLRQFNFEYDNKFCYYYLSTNSIVTHLSNIAELSQATFPSCSSKDIENINLPNFTLNKQRRIASILSAYDNLIENNNRRIRLLEQMAENLYKEWFVRFRFPGHKKAEFENGLPKGWKVLLLSELFNFQEGPGIRNWQYVEKNGTKFINIRCINDSDINIDSANMISTEEANGKYKHFLLKENDIVMSCSGSLGRSAIVRKCHLPLCLNTSVIRFWPKSKDDFSFLYGYLTSTEFINRQQEMASGSAQVNFGPMHLKKIKLLVPIENVRKQYQKFVLPIIEEQNRLKDKNTLLSRQRDLLLPRLMSGKLEVKV